jgi:hypothetical protein
MTARPSAVALGAVGLLGIINLGRGAIHVFAPDSGAGSIAGLDLSAAGATIVFLLASVGVGQIGLGLIDLAAVARWRDFVRPLLAVHVLQAALGVLVLFVLKPPPTPVPGQWFNLALLVVLAAIAAFEFLRVRRHVG